MRPSCKRMPTKLCMMVEAGADHPGVPALLWLPVVQGLLPFNCQCLLMGRGSTQEPQCQFIYLFLHGCHNLFCLHQNLPQFLAETMSPTVFWFFELFRRNHVADVFEVFCHIHVADSFIYFDDDLGHGNHSGELLLFVGCIVIFVVSYLICMFQDSVPAGSYNDPFLSSVISMVAPTWCHGAIWGNPFQGECWLSGILNSHILT